VKYVFGLISFDADGYFIVDLLATYPYYLHGTPQLYFLRFLRFMQTGIVLKGYSLFWKKLIRIFTSSQNDGSNRFCSK
jgi:hypothetical protein